MPLHIVRNDITKMHVDAIVNETNEGLSGNRGVDRSTHHAAGKGLIEKFKQLFGCKTGKAKITKVYNLPCKYVIHTVGPIYRDGKQGEKALLKSCYNESLFLAKKYGCETVAFPLISSGTYGYPTEEALEIATNVISDFILQEDITVYLVILDRDTFQISQKRFSDIETFINDNYVDTHIDKSSNSRTVNDIPSTEYSSIQNHLGKSQNKRAGNVPITPPTSRNSSKEVNLRRTNAHRDISLQEMLSQIDESFSQMLLRKIDEKGMTDAECYKKANIDRKLFSKIRSDIHYKPSKLTAIAFAISLELTLSETKDFLSKAGYALSRSNKFDIIIEYFIRKENYNIFEINEALFAFDQSVL